MHQGGRERNFPMKILRCVAYEALEQQAPISNPLQEWRWFNLRTKIFVEALEHPHNRCCGVMFLVLLHMFRDVDDLRICYAIELFCRICGHLSSESFRRDFTGIGHWLAWKHRGTYERLRGPAAGKVGCGSRILRASIILAEPLPLRS
jgi:hypothetical protein